MSFQGKDKDGNPVTIQQLSALGRLARALSISVTFCDEDSQWIDGLETLITTLNGYVDGLEGLSTTMNGYVDGVEGLLTTIRDLGTKFEACPAGSPTTLGSTGAAGDILSSVLIIPASLSPGAVQIQDGAGGTPITIFPGGANSVGSLVPFSVPLGLKSVTGAWIVTTGANVSALGTGNFT